MVKFLLTFSVISLALSGINPAISQSNLQNQRLQYADLADLAVDAPIIIHATVKKAINVDAERAVSAPAGTQRVYVIANTNALIRGQAGVPEVIRYVIDLPLDARGKAPKIKGKQFIIFAKPIPGRINDLQLATQYGQIPWDADVDSRVRSIVRELVNSNAAPSISGIAGAFHVPGTIIGEGETQIFMETEGQVPVSITILSREGQQKRWAVSLGEIVDESAQAPKRNSLLWYRLACFLPRELPYEVMNGDSPSNANQARRDYQLVLQDLGNCPRTRTGL